MAGQIQRLDNGNIELTLTMPWAKVQAGYEEVITETIANTEIKGFRKGHAPRKLVEERLDRNQTFSHALQHLLPKEYQAAVEEHQLKPVVYPNISIKSGKEGEDWVFVATLCEAPVIKLGAIVHQKDQKLDEVVEKLVKSSEIKLADLLVSHEADHRLSALADNLTRLGLTVDRYLSTKKMTLEELKAKLASEAQHDLQVEFILQQVQIEQKLKDRQNTLDFLTGKV